jgi:hypothetical protein
MLSQIHIGKEGIFAVHPQITADGDSAKGNWLMYIMLCRPPDLAVAVLAPGDI